MDVGPAFKSIFMGKAGTCWNRVKAFAATGLLDGNDQMDQGADEPQARPKPLQRQVVDHGR